MVSLLKYFILFATIIVTTYPQSDDIRQKESELSKIKTEISSLEQELTAKSAAEKKSFEAVENLSKQNSLINKILSRLRAEIVTKEIQIENIERNINKIKSEIKLLQNNYAKYVVAIYKKGEYDELESLIDASSLQQALMRTYYLQVFADQREKDLQDLQNKKNELNESKSLLTNEKNEKLTLLKSQDEEQKILAKKIQEKKSALQSIEKNKKELQKLIAAKKESQQKIELMIVELIEREAEKDKEQIASIDESVTNKNKIIDENTGYEYDLSTSSFASFAQLKGKMIWPLHKGKVIRKFGENRHKSLNTITLNYGIDIKAEKDKNIYCVGEGVIAAIDWLPGYGNVIIVSHRDEYRTVYGHVSEIFVAEGEKIKSGKVMAIVDEGIDGFVLHFELWKGRDKQNPENWLGKR